MTPDEEHIARIEEELDGARRDLHETLSTVEAKVEQQVERAEDAFQPQKMLRDKLLVDNLVGTSLAAGLVGFMIGSSRYRKVMGPVVMIALGYAIWSGLVNEGSDDDGGESVNS
jgi:hypothetical protein